MEAVFFVLGAVEEIFFVLLPLKLQAVEAACFVLWFCALSHPAIEIGWSIFPLVVVWVWV